MNRVDFHSHILPCIDDGSKSEAQSYAMLKEENINEVEQVVVTPHYYPDEPSIKEFINKRNMANSNLRRYIENIGDVNIPKIIQAAEVLLGIDTADLGDLKLLAIEGTEYILIELPYAPWQEWVYECVEKISVTRGLKPIIAHVERYVPFQNSLDDIYRMMTMKGVLGQVNTRSIVDKKTRCLSLKLIENNMVHVLGSDAHRVRHLKELDKAYSYIVSRYGEQKLEELQANARKLLNNEVIVKNECIPLEKVWGRFYMGFREYFKLLLAMHRN